MRNLSIVSVPRQQASTDTMERDTNLLPSSMDYGVRKTILFEYLCLIKQIEKVENSHMRSLLWH